MAWIRTTERLPTDVDWDGSVLVWGEFIRPIPARWWAGWANVWWLAGYRTERPEPPEDP